MTGIKKYIIGNWKSNNGIEATNNWLKEFADVSDLKILQSLNGWEIIICPPFISLMNVYEYIQKTGLPIKIGAQDISPYGDGAYTGEVSTGMLKGITDYVLIGHSERRKYFHEDDKMLALKCQKALENDIIPVYCVPDENTIFPDGVNIVAYEPIWAIGTGKSETPENADKIAFKIKTKRPGINVIYGGSVNADNIKSMISEENIDGVLPGKSSLEPAAFWEMILNASSN